MVACASYTFYGIQWTILGQVITAPIAAPPTIPKYVLEEFVISTQSLVSSGIHSHIARIGNHIYVQDNSYDL
ncbi:MAG: hypothetical protein WAK17_14220 [Candidatus Nitrosopolaris sp.]